MYHQYIEAVSSFGYLPKVLWTDLVGETFFLGDAHWALRRVAEPAIPHADCYSYGRSTENTHIESWWAQLPKSSAFVWRVMASPELSSSVTLLGSSDILVPLLIYSTRPTSRFFEMSIFFYIEYT